MSKSHAQRGRIGGFQAAANRDSKESTAAARAAFSKGFEKQVDPGGTLPPDERERRTTAARNAYFAALAYRSAEARRRRSATRPGGRGEDT